MADKFMSMLGSSPKDSYRKKNDDDWADRLSSKYTVAILMVFTLVVGMTQYVGDPIKCWAPVHFHKSWIKFTQSYCWVKNTYYLPWINNVPRLSDGDLGKEYVQYYQWIPFILITQALLFYLPTVVWHAFNSKGGIDADNILQTSQSLSHIKTAETRDNTIKHVANSMDRFLKSRRETDKFTCDFRSVLAATLCRPCGRRFGNYLVLLFIFSKLCYIANVIGQFFLLDRLLGARFSQYGFYVMESGLESSENWDDASRITFPRVTLCDFDIRSLGNVNRYTVQCVLPINLYNEKIYLFLWFWMAFVLIVSVCSLVTWIIRFLFRGDRLKFIHNHLIQKDKLPEEKDVQLMHRFLDSYLKQDGAFLLRLIAHNGSNVAVTEITCALWDIWLKRDLNIGSEDGGEGGGFDKLNPKEGYQPDYDTNPKASLIMDEVDKDDTSV